MSNHHGPISRAFVSACLIAIGIVLQHPRDAEAWSTALGVVVAAVSGGARKNGNNHPPPSSKPYAH